MKKSRRRRSDSASRSRAIVGSLGVGLVGTKFMGRAHSIAWANAGKFFDLPLELDRRWACGRDAAETHEFGRKWGWRNTSIDYHDMLADGEVQLVDIGTPNDLHKEMALAALEAGKHVACEKPLAGTLRDARAMRDSARVALRRGVRTFVWFNYRRAPAVAFARNLVAQGRIGRVFHVRAAYLQDWGGPSTPLVWRFQGSRAGSGAHGDLNAHSIDMARFITGEEITQVAGSISETFIKERALVSDGKAAISGGKARGKGRMGKSTVDDCVLFLARMSGGAVASFEATRLATGNKNRNRIEVNGEYGAIRFDFERMNELEFWDNTLPSHMQGWTTIMCTDAGHPYASNYWPAAHLIGYEHCFVSQAADIARVLGGLEPEVALPDFEDAWRTQCVLEAAMVSAARKAPVSIAEIARA